MKQEARISVAPSNTVCRVKPNAHAFKGLSKFIHRYIIYYLSFVHDFLM